MNKTILRNYAKLIVKMGVNVQKGQDVIINASVDDNYFVKYVVEECYKAKARKVTVDWSSDDVTRLHYKYQKAKTLGEVTDWRKAKLQYEVETLPARIHIESNDPDALNGLDQDKITEARRLSGPIIMEYREKMDNKYQWTICGIPGVKWAKKVFPNETKTNAMKKMWEAIAKTTRLDGDPIENWQKHNANLKEKYTALNNLKIKTLHYKASNGTDFSVSINPNMIFEGGDESTLGGVVYNPNMPTEECFTSPDRHTANGVVYASKPLSVMGKVVDNFGFKFENGKIVQVIAKNPEHKEVLEKLISLDEGARQLGEVALVPFDSPVNQTGLLFYNTLYDENACCHLAIGRAFEECIKDFQNKTEEEIKAIDLNKSMIHVDFMIGTADLDIVAETYDGKTVQIFKNGTWAF
ncbi:MAG: aminopeptidase [Acholeplasmatales bacterium]|nr:aminopeptidase [Acholeplasmatales bacterium]